MHVSKGLGRAIAVTAAFVLALTFAGRAARAGDEPRAVDAIENDLVAGDPAVRARAAAELNDRFPDGAVAVPMLIDLLDDESPDVVAAAISAIDSMTVAAAGSLAKWLLNDANFNGPLPPTDGTFAEVLNTLTPLKSARAVEVFISATDGHPYGPAEPGAGVIAAVMPFSEITNGMSCLLAIHRGSTGDTRVFAAAALAMLGSDGLVARGFEPPPNQARAAAAASAVRLVNSGSDLRSWCGSRILSRLRAADGATISALSSAVSARKKVLWEHDEPLAAVAACRALGALGARAVQAAGTLRSEISKPATKPNIRLECARSLAICGREADLRDALSREGEDAVSLAGAVALDGRMAEVVVPVLVATLDAPLPSAWPSLRPLAALGPKAAAALPAVRKLADQSKFRSDRLVCLDAVLSISPGDEFAVEQVLAISNESSLGDDDAEAALRILATRAPATPAVVARLRKAVVQAVSGKPPPAWTDAVDGLGRAGAAARESVEPLTRLVGRADRLHADPDHRLVFADDRQRLVIALGRIGPDADMAVAALTALRDKGDETIRVPAAQALRRIQAKK